MTENKYCKNCINAKPKPDKTVALWYCGKHRRFITKHAIASVKGKDCKEYTERVKELTDIKQYYKTNENFKAYVDGMRRIHPEVSVEEVLEKKVVREVAEYYEERDKR